MTLLEKLLALGLTVSLAGNIINKFDQSTPWCDDQYRYTNEKNEYANEEILKGDADKWITGYSDDHPEIDINPPDCYDSRYTVTGFQISKRAIDKIFADTKLNTISTDLIYDNSTGKIGMVFRGLTTPKTKIKDSQIASGVFIVKSICPYDCTIQIKGDTTGTGMPSDSSRGE